MSKLKVLIVDDHRIVRDGLKSALAGQEDIAVAGEAGDGREAVLRAREVEPDVVLMDVMMPGMNGIEACQEIRDSLPDARVLMLTASVSRESVTEAMLAGASGYMVKASGQDDLLRAIRAVGRGESILDPAVTSLVTEGFARLVESQRQNEVEQLTPREKEALLLVAQGATNKEIADRLVISVYTARNMVSNMLGKLGLRNRSELVRWAVERGVLKGAAEE